MDICEVLADKVQREASGNDKLKYGIQYSRNYLDFMILMCGYGHNSHQQYKIFSAKFARPSIQHLRHILGMVMDLAEVEVEDAEDIDEIVDCTIKTGAHTSQAHAILAKVWLLA
ncbi:hypothetical protein C0993_001351 [Termitomyces sp. T159_Od127]|nr:hypothetical protein C0993_001351 [Termitomyces sp. T159_Od127]